MARNQIHETAIIGKDVKLGVGNIVGPYCVIVGDTEIGDDNIFDSHVSIGHPPQLTGFFRTIGKTKIGSGNIFREFATVHGGSNHPTIIGDNNIFMVNTHVAHDCIVQDRVTMSNNSVLAGHCVVMEGAVIALGAVVHQRSIIGAYSMLGMQAVVTKKSRIYPGNIYTGNPAKFLKKNQIGLERNHISDDMLVQFEELYLKLLGDK